MNTNDTAEKIAQESRGISDNSIYLQVIKKITALISRNRNYKTLVDVGCGTGTLLSEINDKAPELKLYGVDLVDYGNKQNYSFIKQDFNEEFKIQNSPFDLVLSTEVIEHLENPRHLLRQLSSITSKQGYIIITTPNPYSLLSILSFYLKGHHSSFGPKNYPAHITPVTPYQIKNMTEELSNLSLEEIIYIPNGRIPGSSKRWSNFGSLFKGRRFSDNYIAIIKKLA